MALNVLLPRITAIDLALLHFTLLLFLRLLNVEPGSMGDTGVLVALPKLREHGAAGHLSSTA